MTSRRLQIQYASTKTYTHEEGLSCCFRQPFADSHCRYLHGYALAIRIEWHAASLDKNNWVADFGDCKEIKAWLKEMYDHRTIIAQDDPALFLFEQMHEGARFGKTIDLRIAPKVGMEAFAAEILTFVHGWTEAKYKGRVGVYSVGVNEHDSNGAIVFNRALITRIEQ